MWTASETVTRLRGWVEVQPDHLAHLGHKVGVGAELERLAPPWLDVVAAPGTGDRGIAQTELAREQPGRPVGRPEALGWRLEGGRDDHRVVDGLGPAAAWLADAFRSAAGLTDSSQA